MQSINTISENQFINKLIRSFPRTELQINQPHESDAEIIRIPGSETLIAITTDSICEEIAQGLYVHPYLIGHMLVTINLSDLAAVGANPIGLMLNITLTHEINDDYLAGLNKGITDACTQYGIAVFGGDTNFSDRIQVGATALGFVSSGHVVSRKGCSSGDILFSSGSLGNGNSFAFQQISYQHQREHEYRPMARIREGGIVSKYATSCIDTSDGCIAALDQLMRVNSLGMNITAAMKDYMHKDSLQLCQQRSLPDWYMLAGPHGEFELIFSVPSLMAEQFLTEAHSIQWHPIRIGVVTGEKTVTLRYQERSVLFDTAQIRNLSFGDQTDLQYFLREFRKIDQSLTGKYI